MLTVLEGKATALDDPAALPFAATSALAYAAMAAVLLWKLPALARTSPAEILQPLRRSDLRVVAVATVVVFALRLLTFGYLLGIGQSAHVQAGLAGFRATGWVASALTVVVGATIAPFSEELLFRGTIYRAIAERMPDGRAAVASGLIFAAARFDVVLAPFFVAYGTLLAVVYRRTGSLFAPIVVRAVFDGASYALLIWLEGAVRP